MPYALESESYTELLWVFEGFTAYYEDLILVRSGLLDEKQFFTILAQKITRLWRTPGRNVQSVTEASFDAWIKFYQPDEHTANITVSYYLKGSLIALILDIYLRELTENTVSLDTILLELWKRFTKKSEGVTNDLVPQLIREYVGTALDDVLHDFLYTTHELPLEAALEKVGVLLQQRAAKNLTDKGEVSYLALESNGFTPVDLGVTYDMRLNTLLIQQCLTGSPAQRAGLSAGDVIVAIDELRVELSTLPAHLARYTPGDTILVHAFRRDQLMTFRVTLAAALPVAVLIIGNDQEAAVHNRQLWLNKI